jgi:hypothetical protein
MDSPFYAPKLAEGGQIVNGETTFKRRGSDEVGSLTIKPIKDDVSVYKFPKTGFTIDWSTKENKDEVFFDVYIGKRSLPPIDTLVSSRDVYFKDICKNKVGTFIIINDEKKYIHFSFLQTEKILDSVENFLNYLRYANNQKAFLENYNPSTRSVYGGKSEGSEDVEKMINIINDDIGTYLEDMGFTPSKESLQDLFKNDGYNRMIIFQELYRWLSENPIPKDYTPTLLELLGKAFTLYKLRKAYATLEKSNLSQRTKDIIGTTTLDYLKKFDAIFHKSQDYVSETVTMFKIVPRLYVKGNRLVEFIGFLVLLVIAKRSQGF